MLNLQPLFTSSFAGQIKQLAGAVKESERLKSSGASEETRLLILEVLRRRPGIKVMEIAESIGMSRESISNHISIMARERPPRVKRSSDSGRFHWIAL